MRQIEKCYSCSYLDTFNCCCSKEPIMMCVSDLAEHDKQIRHEVIDKCIRAIEEDKSLFDNHKTDCIMAIKTRCQNVLKELKGEQNE